MPVGAVVEVQLAADAGTATKTTDEAAKTDVSSALTIRDFPFKVSAPNSAIDESLLWLVARDWIALQKRSDRCKIRLNQSQFGGRASAIS